MGDDAKRDAAIEAVRRDVAAIKTDIAAIDVGLAAMTGDINQLKWMMGMTIALLVTLLFRAFTHGC